MSSPAHDWRIKTVTLAGAAATGEITSAQTGKALNGLTFIDYTYAGRHQSRPHEPTPLHSNPRILTSSRLWLLSRLIKRRTVG
ncbi:MAG: hypothetical protein JWP03_1042 [Phycisphaerales bacterium]|nr:hypothetical protein [Phycisphaerales bacterium]